MVESKSYCQLVRRLINAADDEEKLIQALAYAVQNGDRDDAFRIATELTASLRTKPSYQSRREKIVSVTHS